MKISEFGFRSEIELGVGFEAVRGSEFEIQGLKMSSIYWIWGFTVFMSSKEMQKYTDYIGH